MAVLTYDDRDNAIVYSSGWVGGGTDSEYDSTTMGTNEDGATAIIQFVGTRITVFGTIGTRNTSATRGPVSTYAIDQALPIEFQGAPALDSTQYQQRFFQSAVLADGIHTLTITKVGTDQALWLDFMQVIPSELSGLRTITTTVGGDSVRTLTSLVSHNTSSPQGSGSGSQSSEKTDVGAIVGGVIGGLAILLLAAVGMYFLMKRKPIPDSQSSKASVVYSPIQASQVSPQSGSPFISPFHIPQGQNSHSHSLSYDAGGQGGSVRSFPSTTPTHHPDYKQPINSRP